MRKICYKIGDELELRTCDISLTQRGEPETLEIIKWEGSSCYTLAYWKKGDLMFVGDRPLNVDQDDFFRLVKYGYETLKEGEK